MKKPLSAIIRTYNEAEYIGRLIQNLRNQAEYGKDLEIIAVDSGSNDSTIDILKKHNVSTISIPKKQFNYAKALNTGIEHSRGELIVILSAHAIPADTNWLKKIIRHFEYENVAGVYCRQIPWPDADPLEISRIEKTFEKDSKTFSREKFDDPPGFSNAASCITRRAWQQHHFAIMPAAEDRQWSNWAIKTGYKIIYDAQPKVYHSHSESCRKTAQRTIQLEKSADIKKRTKRNILLTIKQSIAWSIRDIRQIFASQCTINKRLKYSLKCIARSFWYILDFNRN